MEKKRSRLLPINYSKKLQNELYSSPKSFANNFQVKLLLVNGFPRLRRGKPFRIAISNLNSYQTIPHQINLLNSHQIKLQALSLQDLSGWEKYLWKQVQVFPQVNLIAIASEQGEQVTATNLGGGEVLMPLAYRSLDSSMFTYRTNSLGEKTTLANTTPNYNPRKRPWYQKAVTTKKAGWSDIYLHFVDRTPQISAVLPFFDILTGLKPR